jgi:hypothetical protein
MRLAVAAVVLWTATAVAADWKHVKDADFEIDLPGEAKVESDTTDTAIGKVTNTMHQVVVGKAMYALSYADYPADFEKKAIPSKALEGARDGAVANINATLVNDTPVFVDSGMPKRKWPGRDFSATTPQGVKYAARIILVGNRLYQIVAVGEGTYDEATLERMKSTFKPAPPKKKDSPTPR